MKPDRYNTLKGLTAEILVYESVAEGDSAAGADNPNAVLNECNDNLVYRGPLDDVREVICQLVEAETGEKRIVTDTGNKTAKGKAIMKTEQDGEFVNRICALKGWTDLKHLQSKLDDAVKNHGAKDGQPGKPLAVDITKAKREGKPPKLAEKYKLTAGRLLAGTNLQRFIDTNLSQIGKTFTPTGDKSKLYSPKFTDKTGAEKTISVSDADAEALGWLVREWSLFDEQQRMNNTLNE